MRTGNLGGDCESPNYSGRLARYYSFTMGQAGQVEIDLFSTAFDTFLALREGTDAAGRLVVTDDDGGQGSNSRIVRDLSAGTYTVEATSYATGVTGAFTLTVTGSGGGGGGGCAPDDLGALGGAVDADRELGRRLRIAELPGPAGPVLPLHAGAGGPGRDRPGLVGVRRVHDAARGRGRVGASGGDRRRRRPGYRTRASSRTCRRGRTRSRRRRTRRGPRARSR